ncbi:hypothetical protein DPMN_164143 [Dreissena polymorpha]|uniref:Uncharacterized protein n=1 Tax=Dreissena polymorpha TaxID=45954 RepID=A0A9D4ETL2_DREPO|nr:hypothetical protein DPMN_164143 [Dreissena polymorpha]
MASAQVAQSIPEPGSLVDGYEWCDEVETAPVVCEWISGRNAELTAFDSNFQLDRSCKVTMVGSIEALVGHTVGPTPEVPVRVAWGNCHFLRSTQLPKGISQCHWFRVGCRGAS